MTTETFFPACVSQRDIAKLVSGANYDARLQPFLELLRGAVADTGASLEVCYQACVETLQERGFPDLVLWLTAAYVEEVEKGMLRAS